FHVALRQSSEVAPEPDGGLTWHDVWIGRRLDGGEPGAPHGLLTSQSGEIALLGIAQREVTGYVSRLQRDVPRRERDAGLAVGVDGESNGLGSETTSSVTVVTGTNNAPPPVSRGPNDTIVTPTRLLPSVCVNRSTGVGTTLAS